MSFQRAAITINSKVYAIYSVSNHICTITSGTANKREIFSLMWRSIAVFRIAHKHFALLRQTDRHSRPNPMIHCAQFPYIQIGSEQKKQRKKERQKRKTRKEIRMRIAKPTKYSNTHHHPRLSLALEKGTPSLHHTQSSFVRISQSHIISTSVQLLLRMLMLQHTIF